MPDQPSESELTAIITTEHFTLQTARAAAINQANGRAGTYLGVVSTSLIALALVGQTSGLGRFFYVFGLLLFVPLLFMGFFTFERTLQLGLEDVSYAARINRLRRFYFRFADALGDYLIRPIQTDDVVAVMQQGGARYFRRLEGFTTTAGVIATVNSFLAAVLVGFAVELIGGDPVALIPMGGIAFLAFAVAQFRHAMRAWSDVRSRFEGGGLQGVDV